MDRVPHDADAERAVLAAVLMDNAQMAELSRLRVASFYVNYHARIFAGMLSLWEEAQAIDPITLVARMRAEGHLHEHETAATVLSLTTGMPAQGNLKLHVEQIIEQAQRRWFGKIGAELQLHSSDSSANETMTWLDGKLDAARPKVSDQREGIRPLSMLERGQQLRYDKFFKGISDCIPSGFANIDRELTGSGFGRTQLIIVAARPSVGKTSLCLDIAANTSLAEKKVLLFSLEMSAEMLLDRLVSVDADVPRWKIQAGIYQRDYEKISASLPQVCQRQIMVDDTAQSLGDIQRRVRALMRSTPVDLIIVDYLQLVSAEQRQGTRNDDVGEVSRALKMMAMEWNVPVIALSQLSRNCESNNREPELRDLRDSGEIEQNADIVFLMFGDKPNEGTTFRDVTLKCAKQREGKLFRTTLPFNGELVTFRSLAQIVAQPVPDYDWMH